MASATELQRRLDAVCDEIRHYPTPIARCDEQLTALIEERSLLLHALQKPSGCTPEGIWDNEGGFHAAQPA